MRGRRWEGSGEGRFGVGLGGGGSGRCGLRLLRWRARWSALSLAERWGGLRIWGEGGRGKPWFFVLDGGISGILMSGGFVLASRTLTRGAWFDNQQSGLGRCGIRDLALFALFYAIEISRPLFDQVMI